MVFWATSICTAIYIYEQTKLWMNASTHRNEASQSVGLFCLEKLILLSLDHKFTIGHGVAWLLLLLQNTRLIPSYITIIILIRGSKQNNSTMPIIGRTAFTVE